MIVLTLGKLLTASGSSFLYSAHSVPRMTKSASFRAANRSDSEINPEDFFSKASNETGSWTVTMPPRACSLSAISRAGESRRSSLSGLKLIPSIVIFLLLTWPSSSVASETIRWRLRRFI